MAETLLYNRFIVEMQHDIKNYA